MSNEGAGGTVVRSIKSWHPAWKFAVVCAVNSCQNHQLLRSQNCCMVNNVHTQKHAIHPLPRRPPQLGHIGGHGIDFTAWKV